MTYLLVIILSTGNLQVTRQIADLNVCRQEARHQSAKTGSNYGCVPIYLEGPRAPLR